MAEEQVDGGQTDGTATNANGNASAQSGVQQPSFDAAKLQESLDTLTSGFQELTARVNGLQGKKDTEISGLRKKIAEYKELEDKLGPDGAIEQIERNDQFAQMAQALQDIQQKLSGSASTQTPGTGASGADALAQVINDLQLDANDPAVVKILAESQGDTVKGATALGAYNATRASKQPTPAASTTMTTGSASSNINIEEELAKMDELNKGNDMAAIKKQADVLHNAGVPGW